MTDWQRLLTDHNLCLFYFFPEAPNPSALSSCDLRLRPPLPEPLKDALGDWLQAGNTLWRPVEYNLRKDFLPHVRALFGSRSRHQEESHCWLCRFFRSKLEAAGGNAPVIQTWALRTEVRKLLNGSSRPFPGKAKIEGRQLILLLKNSATARLRRAGSKETVRVLVAIEDVQCHRFKTGFGVAVVNVALKDAAPTFALLLECLYALIHNQKLAWGADVSDVSSHIGLGRLVRAMLGNADGSRDDRVFTHAYACLEPPLTPKTLDTVALFLARHHTSDYQLSDARGENVLLRDYDNVHHCVAYEGAATVVVVSADGPQSLRNYLDNSLWPAYVPIMLLNFHSEQVLQHYLARTDLWLEETPPPMPTLQTLTRQQYALTNLDAHFFLPVLSRINSHNRFHRALMEIKRLDGQFALADKITRLIGDLIASDREARKTRRFCLFVPIRAAAAAYLTVFSILQETQEVLLKEGWVDATGWLHAWLHHHQGTISLVGAVAASLATWLISYFKCGSHGSEEPHHRVHEMAEILHLFHLSEKRRK